MTNTRQVDTTRRENETVQQQYIRLVKVANRRLDRLEDLSKEQHYGDVLNYAYRVAITNLKKWTKDDNRYSYRVKNIPEHRLEWMIADLSKFINLPTSNKKGITSIYKARATTINQKYGTKFRWQELASFFEKGLFEQFKNNYGSATAFETIAEIQKLKPETIEVIKNSAKTEEELLNRIKDPVVKYYVEDAIKENYEIVKQLKGK